MTFKATDANLQRHVELLIEDWFSQPGLKAKKDEGDDVNSFLNCVGFGGRGPFRGKVALRIKPIASIASVDR